MSSTINFLSSIGSSFKQLALRSVQTLLENKVAAIGLLVIAGLAIYVCSYCLKNKKIDRIAEKDTLDNAETGKTKNVVTEKLVPESHPREKPAPELKNELPEPVDLQNKIPESWSELQAFMKQDHLQNLDQIEIPGKGRFPKKMIELLLTQYDKITWKELNRTQITHFSDKRVEMNGWIRAILCMQSKEIKTRYDEAFQQKGHLYLDQMAYSEFETLMKLLFREAPLDDFQDALLGFNLADFFEIPSLKNDCEKRLKKWIAEWSVKEKYIKQAVEIFNGVKNNEKEEDGLKEACQGYFIRAILNPGTLSQMIKYEPEIANIIFIAAAIEKLKDYNTSEEEKDPIIFRFRDVLVFLSEADENGLAFLLDLLRRINDLRQLSRIFEYVSDGQLEVLTKMILKGVAQPLDIISQLMKFLTQEKIKIILEVFLPTIKDPIRLQKLWDEEREPGITYSKLARQCDLLSNEQIKQLIDHWHGNLPKEKVIENMIGVFCNRTLFPKGLKELVDYCHGIGIDVEQFTDKELLPKSQLLPYLCGCSVLHTIDSAESEDQKIEKFLRIMEKMSSLEDSADKDHHCLFGYFLAETCSSEQVAIILQGFHSYQDIGSRQRLAYSFLSHLLKTRTSEEETIRQAFTAYWPIWISFDQYSIGCSYPLLEEIRSEQILKIAYEAVPAEQKEEIKALFRGTYFRMGIGYNWSYRIKLDQEVIDRVLN